jgi:hypothetical protein
MGRLLVLNHESFRLLPYVQGEQDAESGDQDTDDQQCDFKSKPVTKHFYDL